ncbi:ABC transporter ATP-binding protein [Microlunatus speluncae]|uniref:ABC transporter ATP-binding protein n=1 Tax=Microlunatus speluncae TaxID=2594267 RepID=UPI0012660BE8|nr:ABC transporter ATP-binding protein [Microlunatus speluncae]
MRDLFRVIGPLLRYDLRRYLIGGLFWLPVRVLPLITGLVLKLIFDAISGGQRIDLPLTWWLCALFVAAELVRSLIMWLAWTYGVYWWDATATVLRANLLRSILTAPGAPAGRLPATSGATMARLRDDVANLVDFSDDFIALTGTLLFAIGALAVLAAIDWVIMVALVVPMIIVAILSTWANRTVTRLYAEAQERGARVVGFLGETFNSILAVRTGGAEASVGARLARLNRDRRRAEVRSRSASSLLDAATGASVELGIGLVLLLAAGALRSGELTVGDIVIFTTYVSWLTALPRTLGAMLLKAPRAAVATQRLGRLISPQESVEDLVRDTTVWYGATEAPDPPPAGRHPDPLRELEVRDLTVRQPGGRAVVQDVTFRIRRGSVTMITGAVGAGKTTVLRGLLGLIDLDGGSIRWNGRDVSEPGTFLVPPRVAYASQTPRLFSASIRENLRLGWADHDLDRALQLAALTEDVAAMPAGLATMIGPRGVRLSGGQLQRTAAARAILRRPDLLIVDDLSSALDVETEAQLWQRLTAEAALATDPITVLAVSHRRAALAQATDIVVLDQGRVVGQGPLDQLLSNCAELRRLWAEETDLEAGERGDGYTRLAAYPGRRP